jgi:hypothetical protein
VDTRDPNSEAAGQSDDDRPEDGKDGQREKAAASEG